MSSLSVGHCGPAGPRGHRQAWPGGGGGHESPGQATPWPAREPARGSSSSEPESITIAAAGPPAWTVSGPARALPPATGTRGSLKELPESDSEALAGFLCSLTWAQTDSLPLALPMLSQFCVARGSFTARRPRTGRSLRLLVSAHCSGSHCLRLTRTMSKPL